MTGPAPNPLIRQAKAAIDRQDFSAAARLCEQMLARKRNDVNAVMLKADLLGATGRLAEELATIEQAMRIEPKNARLRADLGQKLSTRGRHRAALAQFEKALKLEQGLPAAVAGAAAAWEGEDRYDRARRALEPALRGGAPPPIVASVALRVLVHDRDLEEAIALGERVGGAGHPPSMALRATLFTLAKAHELNGDYDRAFATAGRANAMLAPPYDREAAARDFEAVRRTFTRDVIAALPRPDEAPETPVFIVGFPRCGSTLTERILHAHPDAHGAGETDALLRALNRIAAGLGPGPGWPESIRGLDHETVERESAAYLEELCREAPAASRIANKHLGNFMHLGLIAALFPGAQIIHCRRDPVDTCLSCYLERLTPAQAPFATDLRNLGHHHRLYQEVMEHWRRELDHLVLEVDYETLIADQEGTTRAILDHCGLAWNDASLRPHEVKRADATLSFDQVRRPLYKSSVGRAGRFGALLDPLREALAG